MPWCLTSRPPPPPHSVLFRVRVCLFPSLWKHPLSPDSQSMLEPDFVARKVPLYRRFREHACGPSDPGVGGPGLSYPLFSYMWSFSSCPGLALMYGLMRMLHLIKLIFHDNVSLLLINIIITSTGMKGRLNIPSSNVRTSCSGDHGPSPTRLYARTWMV